MDIEILTRENITKFRYLSIALIERGFEDVSHEQNGLSYRKKLPCKKSEICIYADEYIFRYQSIDSGFTTKLNGVTTLNKLGTFWKLLTGEELSTSRKRGKET